MFAPASHKKRDTAATIAAYLDFTEKRFRAAINRLPRVCYVAEDFLDGDGVSDAPLKIKVRIKINHNRAEVDFCGRIVFIFPAIFSGRPIDADFGGVEIGPASARFAA